MSDLIFHWNPAIFIGIVIVLMLAVMELTYRFGRPLVQHFQTSDELWNAIQTGLFALVAFMLGFSFAQAEGRYDARRTLVLKEANDIGTTWLRAGQLPTTQRDAFRRELTSYGLDRLRAYEAPSNTAQFAQRQAESDSEQATLWSITSQALALHPTNLGYSLLMVELNDVIDDATEQRAALTQHVPVPAIVLTLLLLLATMFSLGLSFARVNRRPAVFSIVYVLAIALVFEMVIDYDRPQTGLIRVSLAPLQWQLDAMQH
jgi:hypothetical protein